MALHGVKPVGRVPGPARKAFTAQQGLPRPGPGPVAVPNTTAQRDRGAHCPCLLGLELVRAGSLQLSTIRRSHITAHSSDASGGTGGFYSEGVEDDESVATHTERVEAHACPMGHYCRGGVKYPCPAGRYGGTHGLTKKQCTGICSSGYYCPPGSAAPTQVECGGSDVYCPAGSGQPTPVTVGYYTVGGTLTTRKAQRACEPGTYCVDGIRHYCGPGR